WWRRWVSGGGGKWRMRESGSGDRVDPLMGSIFGLRRKNPPEKFSGGGSGGRRWLEGGRIFEGERGGR
ncbi:hypothetical protein Tco_0602793, partial [Tanacetum coccineum]